MAREEELITERLIEEESVLVGVVHAVGVLLARDLVGEELDFQVGLQQLDVHQLAFGSVATIGPHHLQGHVPVMRLDKSMHQLWIHIRILRLGDTVCYWAYALGLAYFKLTLARYLAWIQISNPRQVTSSGPTGNVANEMVECSDPSRIAQITPLTATTHPNRPSQKLLMGANVACIRAHDMTYRS